jgi:hypothetical protein
MNEREDGCQYCGGNCCDGNGEALQQALRERDEARALIHAVRTQCGNLRAEQSAGAIALLGWLDSILYRISDTSPRYSLPVIDTESNCIGHED